MVNFAEAEPLFPEFIGGTELVSFYQDIRKAATVQTEMLIHTFNMHRILPRPGNTYSSGMAKILSLLLSFIGIPALILLDGPLATLDSGSGHILPNLMNACSKEFNTSFIFSSHKPFHSGSRKIHNLCIIDQTLQ